MLKAVVVTLILLSGLAMGQTPPAQRKVINAGSISFPQNIKYFELSPDESELLLVREAEVMIMGQVGGNYLLSKQNFTFDDPVEYAHYAPDGNTILIVERNGKARIFQRSSSSTAFAQQHEITAVTSVVNKTYAGAISDNLGLVAVGDGKSIKLFNLDLTSPSSSLNKSINLDIPSAEFEKIFSLKFYQNYLVAQYRRNSSDSFAKFYDTDLSQLAEIPSTASNIHSRLNSNPKFYSVPDTDSELNYYSIYGFSATNQGSISMQIGDYLYSSIANDGSLVAVLGTDGLLIAGIPEGKLSSFALSTQFTVSQISSDNKKIYLAKDSDFYTYVDCGANNLSYILSEDKECISCDPHCSSCESQTTCGQCNEASNYGLAANFTCQLCLQTNDEYIDEGGFCQLCDGNRYIAKKECLNCTLTGCNKCTDQKTCQICDSNSSYYLRDGSCIFCDESKDQFLSNGSCSSCALTGCTDCASATACGQCDTNNGYTLDQSTQQCVLSSDGQSNDSQSDNRSNTPVILGAVLGVFALGSVIGMIAYGMVSAQPQPSASNAPAGETQKNLGE